ncbi:MAG: thiamine pyrophosphate-dependent enzyme [Thermodesulfobacteriota bacterium]
MPEPHKPQGTFNLDFSLPSGSETSGAIVFLVDGVNTEVFNEMLENGELPAIRYYFIDRGLYCPRTMVNTPSVTLANETSVVTGVFPGHHNITGINWFDRNRLIWRDYETIAQKAAAYGFEKGIQVDGNDILAVYSAARDAVERARKGKGPALIECVTYRLQMHTTADDPKRYRTDEEVEEWKEKDPISRFETFLKDRELLDDEKIESIGEEIKAKINDAVKKAEKAFEKMGDPLDMFNHVYAEMPPRLNAQREWLAAEIEGGEGDNG